MQTILFWLIIMLVCSVHVCMPVYINSFYAFRTEYTPIMDSYRYMRVDFWVNTYVHLLFHYINTYG